jgi:hypothetical protein
VDGAAILRLENIYAYHNPGPSRSKDPAMNAAALLSALWAADEHGNLAGCHFNPEKTRRPGDTAS